VCSALQIQQALGINTGWEYFRYRQYHIPITGGFVTMRNKPEAMTFAY